MSEYSIPEERTEMPTDRRMSQLRREGALHFSQDVVQVLSLLTGFWMLTLMWSSLFNDMKLTFVQAFSAIASREPLTVQVLHNGAIKLMLLIGPHVLAIVAIVALISSLALLYQTKWNIKEKKFDFKLFRLNPLAGLKRIFSLNGWVNTGKALLKLSVILPLGFFALKDFAPAMIALVHVGVEEVLVYTGTTLATLFWRILYVLIGFAIFDYVWGRRQWLRNNKMTKSEVRDERKSVEGDEETKKKIQVKGFQRILQRIKSTVPQADVVVTNPTHIAIALKYDRKTMNAPVVVAKGKGFLAERIRAIARESGVPILERKPLARALWASVEVGASIPHELFKAVAEVLAYVYRLKNPYAYANPGGVK